MIQSKKHIMKHIQHSFTFLALSVLLFSCKQEVSQSVITTYHDSVSYSLGMIYAQKLPENLQENHIDSLSYDFFLQGMCDFFDTNTTNHISDVEIKDITNSYIQQLHLKREELHIESYKINIEKGEQFLQENKENYGVVEVEQGLQYKTIYAGWGQQKPTLLDTVLVNYQVYSIDNTLLYDSKTESNEAVSIVLDSTILAWQKIIPLYVTGGKVRIFASHDFAYGSAYSKKSNIEPFATLIFDVELYKFIKGTKKPETIVTQEQNQNNITTQENI